MYLLMLFIAALGFLAFSQLRFTPQFSPFGMASQADINDYKEFDERFLKESSESGAIFILKRNEGWKSYEDFRILDSITRITQDILSTKVYSITNLSMPAKGLLGFSQKQILSLKTKSSFVNSKNRLEKMDYARSKFISEDRKLALLFIDSVSKLSKNVAIRLEKIGRDYCKVYFYNSVDSQKEDSLGLILETVLIGLIALILVLFGFYFMTKSLTGIWLIGLVILSNIGLTFLFMFVMRIPFNISMIAIPCLIVVLSFSDLMHIFHHQAKHAMQFEDDISLQKDIVRKIQFPMILTSFTNLIGFIVYLIVSDNTMLTQLATVSIFGVVIAYLSSRYLVIPLMDRNTSYIKRKELNEFGGNLLKGIFWFQKHRRATMIGSLLLFIISAVALVGEFKVDLKVENYISSNSTNFSARKLLSDNFFGSKSGEIIVQHRDPNDKWTHSHQLKIDLIEKEIESLFNPMHLTSSNSLVKRFNQISVNGNPNAYRLMRNLNPELINPFVNELGGKKIVSIDNKMTRLKWGFKDEGIPENLRKFEALEMKLKVLNGEGGQFLLSGKSILADRSVLSYSKKIILGLIIAIFLTSFIILYYLKSVRWSIGTFLVNAMPLTICLLLMLYSNVQVNPQSLFLLTVLAGLCLDDSIYLMSYQSKKIKEYVLFPISTTSLVLALAFFSLFFSSYIWLQEFSFIFIIGLSLAFFMDIFIYPVFMNSKKQKYGK